MFNVARALLYRLTNGLHKAERGDQRAWLRHAAGPTLIVFRADQPDPTVARVLDVARGGVRLLVSEPVKPGAILFVDIPEHAGSPPAVILAYAIRIRRLEPGIWSLGCRFATELNEGDVQALADLPIRTPEPSSRPKERPPVPGPTGTDRPIRPARTSRHLQPLPHRPRRPADPRSEPGMLLNVELLGPAGVSVGPILGCVVYMPASGPVPG